MGKKKKINSEPTAARQIQEKEASRKRDDDANRRAREAFGKGKK